MNRLLLPRVATILPRVGNLARGRRRLASCDAAEIRSRLVADLEKLGLSNRVRNILEGNGVSTIDDLLTWNGRELLALPRFGKGCFAEVVEKLEEGGLALAVDPFAPYMCARHGDP